MFIARRFALGKDPTKRIISFWEKGGPDFNYFEAAEDQQWIRMFWQPETVFNKLFSKLSLDAVLEIACGAGRHSFQVVEQVNQLYLLDSSAGAIELARAKFSKYHHVRFIHHPGGLGIPPSAIPAASLTAVFSFDAMVHFEKEAVLAYMRDAYDVLKPGGHCLLHYSNYDKNPGGKFSDNPGWRNYMTQEIFNSYVQEIGFTLLDTELIDFSGPASDAISLLKK